MKNIMRRTVAFMLFACLLLSVMAPVSVIKADATSTVGNIIEYDVDGSALSYRLFGSLYICSLTKLGDDNPKIHELGDVSHLPAGTNVSNIRVYRTETGVEGEYEYAIGANSFQITPEDGNADNDNKWIAIKFTVEEADQYILSLNATGMYAELIVEEYDENKTYDDAYVAGLEAQGEHKKDTTNAPINKNFEQGDYVLFVRSHTANTQSNIRIYNINLTKTPAATVETKYDFYGLKDVLSIPHGSHVYFDRNQTKYSEAYGEGKINFMPYAASSTIYAENENQNRTNYFGLLSQSNVGSFIAVEIDNPGAGSYDVNFTTYAVANCSARIDLYLLPISTVEAALAAAKADDAEATEVTAIENLLASGDYSAVASSNKSNECTPGTIEITGTEKYIAVFHAAVDRDGKLPGEGSRPTAWMIIYGMSFTQTSYSLQDALDAGNAFSTVAMLKDSLATGTLNLGTGATLDLNGCAVNGNVNVTYGNLVDSSDAAGSVAGTVNVAAGNDALPIKDGNVTRLYAVEKKASGYEVVDEGVNFYFDLDMAEDVYALVASGNFKIGATLTVGGTPVDAIVDMDEAVQDWLTNKGIYNGEDGCLWIELTGLETVAAGTEIVVTPIFENVETGVSGMFGGPITYTVPAAE